MKKGVCGVHQLYQLSNEIVKLFTSDDLAAEVTDAAEQMSKSQKEPDGDSIL